MSGLPAPRRLNSTTDEATNFYPPDPLVGSATDYEGDSYFNMPTGRLFVLSPLLSGHDENTYYNINIICACLFTILYPLIHTHRQTRTRARVCFLFVCVCSFYYEHICILENVGGGHDCRMYGKNKPMGPSFVFFNNWCVSLIKDATSRMLTLQNANSLLSFTCLVWPLSQFGVFSLSAS